MRVISALNVNDAYARGVSMLLLEGERQPSRVGEVLVMPCPVTTVYHRPLERVLFDEERNANPFFHLGEALWMLQGRNDAQWLDRFVADFSDRFVEADGKQHGAYGFRWLHHFDMEGGGEEEQPDQLTKIVNLLKPNHYERRAVLTMWDPVADLGRNKKDLPCNTHVYFRVRQGTDQGLPVLDMTVCCRSNDIIWGAYGANAVHFSVLLEYMAARIGVAMGNYYQISNNFHGYVDTLTKPADYRRVTDPYGAVLSTPLVTDENSFDDEVRVILSKLDGDKSPMPSAFRNVTLATVVWPVLYSYKLWRAGKRREAISLIAEAGEVGLHDWLVAASAWYVRKLKGKK